MNWPFKSKTSVEELKRAEINRRASAAASARRTMELQEALAAAVNEFLPKKEARHD